jgi:hypothetical protein
VSSYFISEHFPKEMGKKEKKGDISVVSVPARKRKGVFAQKKTRAKKRQLWYSKPPTD